MVPSNGPFAGGNTVTLIGDMLGLNDITSVSLGTLSVTQHTWMSSTLILLTAPGASTPGAVTVSLVTASNGPTFMANGYTFNIPMTISAVVPSIGPNTGGQTVTITGSASLFAIIE